jgi:hypothetical protein
MRRSRAALCVLICAACQAATAATAAAPVAGYQAVARDITSEALDRALARRVLLVSGNDSTPLANGLRKLAKADPRFSIPVGSSFSPPSKGGVIMVRRAETAVRADKAIKALAASAAPSGRQAGNLDVAALDLSSESLPDGKRIAAPVRFFTAGMEINMTNADLVGSMTETISGFQTIGNSNTGGVVVPANFPIELPNIGVQHLSTQSAVPAGSALDDGGWRPSPRDPRKAISDVVGGLEALAKGVQPVYTTLPLERAGNAQRNWYNQMLRDWCAKNGRPLLDVAEILSTGTDGTVARDAEGPRLADAWDGPEQRDEAQMRLARAWWWLQTQL